MRFELDVDIAAPPDDVWRAFEDPANTPRWQPTLQSFERISGEPGWPGAVSLLVYHEGGRKIEMTETITARDEGRHLAGRYDNAWAVNEMACTFETLPDGGTRWRALAEFRFKGWTKLLAPLLRAGIRKRLEDDMLRFKELVESGALPAPPPGSRVVQGRPGRELH
jgi:uncharacterized protein YndB with AHSA1/START domain